MVYTCNHCHKECTTKTTLKNHAVLCDFLYTTQREKQTEFEETTDLPKYHELVFMNRALVEKYTDLTEKVTKMEKALSCYYKCKLNVLDWLKTNVHPGHTLQGWASQAHSPKSRDIAHVLDARPLQAIYTMLGAIIEKGRSPFAMVNGEFCVYDIETTTGDPCWVKYNNRCLLVGLNKMLQSLLDSLNEWRVANIQKIDTCDALSAKYNKALIKLMGMNFQEGGTLGKIKTFICEQVKYDVKNVVEYVVE
jgi:hypothetical protein